MGKGGASSDSSLKIRVWIDQKEKTITSFIDDDGDPQIARLRTISRLTAQLNEAFETVIKIKVLSLTLYFKVYYQEKTCRKFSNVE